VAAVVEVMSWLLIRALSANSAGLDVEVVKALFGTKPMPPMPLYLLSAGASAIALIVLCVTLTEMFSTASWVKPFVSTGQLALTLYVAHVVIGMGVLELFGALENQTLFFAISSAVMFCIIGVTFSHYWRKHFSRGPLEWAMRCSTELSFGRMIPRELRPDGE
jgi:uncharacterized membrane protein YeiB